MPQSTNPIAAAAADFGRHLKGGGGWALGLEVAACVKPNGHGGDRRSSRRNHASKVNATEFARMSGTTHDRVIRHLTAWERAAAEGVVAAADTISPSEWDDPDHLPEGYEWGDFYDASAAAGQNVRDPERRERLETAATRRGVGRSKVLDVASNPRAVAAALDADPTFAQQVHTERARAQAQEMAEGLPDAPFDTPPRPFPDAAAAEAQMDVRRDEAHLHDAIGRIVGHARSRPQMLDLVRLEAERDLLATAIIEAAEAQAEVPG